MPEQVDTELNRHPTPDELLDYHVRDASPEQRERIQDHLTLCPQCVQAVLDLDRFPNLPISGPERLSSTELVAEWELFRERAKQARSYSGRRFLPWSLAAALLIAIAGAGIQMTRLQRQVEDLSQPRGGVELLDLFPVDGELERVEEEREGVQLLPWSDRLVLILNLADVRSFPEYEAEILTAEGREVWRGGGLRRTPEGTFALEVPRRFLPVGSYRIRLFTGTSHGRILVAEYSLLVHD